MANRFTMAVKAFLDPHKHLKNPTEIMSESEKALIADQIAESRKPLLNQLEKQKNEIEEERKKSIKRLGYGTVIGAGSLYAGQTGYKKYKANERKKLKELKAANQLPNNS